MEVVKGKTVVGTQCSHSALEKESHIPAVPHTEQLFVWTQIINLSLP